MYEYLPALGSLLALYLGIRYRREPKTEALDGSELPENPATELTATTEVPTLSLLGFWTITSLVAYTVAGEKMPWLTVHIAWPIILLTGWALGYLIETTDWQAFRQKRGLLLITILIVFLTSLTAVISTVIGPNPPFQGRELNHLQSTSTFLMAAITVIGSGFGLVYFLKEWDGGEIRRIVIYSAFGLLALLSARSAFVATYVNL